jgi:hypothetical protein
MKRAAQIRRPSADEHHVHLQGFSLNLLSHINLCDNPFIERLEYFWLKK